MADFDPRSCPVGIELSARMTTLEKTIDVKLEDIKSDLRILNNTVERLIEALYGNGGPGMRIELNDARARLSRLESEMQTNQAWTRQVILTRWGWVVALLIAVISAIIALLGRKYGG